MLRAIALVLLFVLAALAGCVGRPAPVSTPPVPAWTRPSQLEPVLLLPDEDSLPFLYAWRAPADAGWLRVDAWCECALSVSVRAEVHGVITDTSQIHHAVLRNLTPFLEDASADTPWSIYRGAEEPVLLQEDMFAGTTRPRTMHSWLLFVRDVGDARLSLVVGTQQPLQETNWRAFHGQTWSSESGAPSDAQPAFAWADQEASYVEVTWRLWSDAPKVLALHQDGEPHEVTRHPVVWRWVRHADGAALAGPAWAAAPGQAQLWAQAAGAPPPGAPPAEGGLQLHRIPLPGLEVARWAPTRQPDETPTIPVPGRAATPCTAPRHAAPGDGDPDATALKALHLLPAAQVEGVLAFGFDGGVVGWIDDGPSDARTHFHCPAEDVTWDVWTQPFAAGSAVFDAGAVAVRLRAGPTSYPTGIQRLGGDSPFLRPEGIGSPVLLDMDGQEVLYANGFGLQGGPSLYVHRFSAWGPRQVHPVPVETCTEALDGQLQAGQVHVLVSNATDGCATELWELGDSPRRLAALEQVVPVRLDRDGDRLLVIGRAPQEDPQARAPFFAGPCVLRAFGLDGTPIPLPERDWEATCDAAAFQWPYLAFAEGGDAAGHACIAVDLRDGQTHVLVPAGILRCEDIDLDGPAFAAVAIKWDAGRVNNLSRVIVWGLLPDAVVPPPPALATPSLPVEGWPMAGRDAARTSAIRPVPALPLRSAWNVDLGETVVHSPVVDSDMVVAATTSSLVAVSRDGEMIWRAGVDGWMTSGPVLSGGRVYALVADLDTPGPQMSVKSFDAATGAPSATLPAASGWGWALLLHEGGVYTANSTLLMRSGENAVPWTYPHGAARVVPWEEGLLVSRWYVAEALDMDGTIRWNVSMTSAPSGDPAAGRGLFIVPLGDGLLALDAATGAQVWMAPVRDARTVTITGDVVVYNLHHEVGARDLATGKLRWRLAVPVEDGGAIAIAAADGRVFALTGSGGVLVLEASDGTVLQRLSEHALTYTPAPPGAESWMPFGEASIVTGGLAVDEALFATLRTELVALEATE